jgi:hypothetical protein
MFINKKFRIFFTGALILFLPFFARAQGMLDRLKNAGQAGGYDTGSTDSGDTILAATIGKVVFAFLSLLGTIFIILMLLAGYNWMTAAGEEEKVNKAKDTIRRAIIGLIIIVSAWSIWLFISKYLLESEYEDQ